MFISELLWSEISPPPPQFSNSSTKMLSYGIKYTLHSKFHPQNLLVPPNNCYPRITSGRVLPCNIIFILQSPTERNIMEELSDFLSRTATITTSSNGDVAQTTSQTTTAKPSTIKDVSNTLHIVYVICCACPSEGFRFKF